MKSAIKDIMYAILEVIAMAFVGWASRAYHYTGGQTVFMLVLTFATLRIATREIVCIFSNWRRNKKATIK